MGLASQEYHDSFGTFPGGWYCDNSGGPNVRHQLRAGPWPSLICGMASSGLFLKLELGNIYNELNFSLIHQRRHQRQQHGRPVGR